MSATMQLEHAAADSLVPQRQKRMISDAIAC